MTTSISFQATATISSTGTSRTLNFKVTSAAGQERLVALATTNGSITSSPVKNSEAAD
jgi:hypothetical protein